MSAALVRWSATLGFQLVSSLARLLGTRVASALFVSATGRVLLRLLVHTVGGPLAFIPQSVLASAVNSVVPSPVILLRSFRAGVRVVYVLLETPIAQGAKRVLVHLSNSAFTAPLPEQRAQWLNNAHSPLPIEEYTPDQRHIILPTAPPIRVQDIIDSKAAEASPEAQSTLMPSPDRALESSIMRISPIVLELTEKELAEVEAHFDGERTSVEATELPKFLSDRGRNDEAALSASRIVAGNATLDDTWQPAELLLHSRHSSAGDGELTAALCVGDSPIHSGLDEGWIPLDALCAPSPSPSH
jgi:hypothetical protein